MDDSTTAPRKPFLTNSRLAWLCVVTLVVAAVAFFVADNFAIVRVRVLTLSFQTRLAWVMLVSLLIGLTGGFLLAGFLFGGFGRLFRRQR
jgi:uncharacterized membrane protein